jgi:hypothetical protein
MVSAPAGVYHEGVAIEQGTRYILTVCIVDAARLKLHF